MSTIFYRYENSTSVKKDGKSHVHKETLIDGAKGLSFTYVKKLGDKSFTKVSCKQEGDVFKCMVKKDEKVENVEMDEKKLLAMLAKDKSLAFVLNYMKKDRSKVKKASGMARSRRKSSKKGSRKGSKKKSSKKRR